MLTIFTTPKPFTGHDNVIQTNAIKSWTLLRPPCEIILMGRDEGTAEIASELGLRHIPEIECNEYGTPLLSSIFKAAQDTASNELMCYINADIILLSDFIPAVRRMRQEPSLMIGQRWDIDIDRPIDFEDSRWEQQLRTRLAEDGELHPESGMDYFIFSKGLYADIPPFALGRTSWDNWLVYRARYLRVPVINATGLVTAVHQNHGYAHIPDGRKGAFKGPEALRNQAILGGWEYSFGISHATQILTEQGPRRVKNTLRHLILQLDSLPVLQPRLGFLGIFRRALMAISKAIGGKLKKTG